MAPWRCTKHSPCESAARELHTASTALTWHQSKLMPSQSNYCEVRSGRSRKGTEHPIAEDAVAIGVAPNPADNLHTEITYGILSNFLIEDHVLDQLPSP